MSEEKIIKQIKADAEEEIQKINKDALKKAEGIVEQSKSDAEKKAEKIKKQGEEKAEKTKKVLLSQANQEVKRKKLQKKEEIIDQCFNKAVEKIKEIKGKKYEDIVATLIKKGRRQIDGECKVYTSRKEDKSIVKKMGLKHAGEIQASGGIMLKSKDGKITVDNTFEGILKQKKDEIRIKVGQLLFSQK